MWRSRGHLSKVKGLHIGAEAWTVVLDWKEALLTDVLPGVQMSTNKVLNNIM